MLMVPKLGFEPTDGDAGDVPNGCGRDIPNE